ncbi:hypothetical protein J5751_04940 [bacterium]|nr:hypothetical protein [bacterium]
MEHNDFELVIGCMKAGKSKYLIDCFVGNETIEAYKPSTDTRNPHFITSRAYEGYEEMKIPCKQVSSLHDVYPVQPIVIVDEFQFFNAEELKDFVKRCKEEHRRLVLAGLDLLADGTEWSSYTAVKPMADKITKLRASCSICCKPAEYSQKITGEKGLQVEIEGEATYEPRCKEHYEFSI